MALLLVLYVHSIPEIGYDWTCIREKYYWVFPYKVTCCGSEDSSETGISSIWLLLGTLNPLHQKYVEMRKMLKIDLGQFLDSSFGISNQNKLLRFFCQLQGLGFYRETVL